MRRRRPLLSERDCLSGADLPEFVDDLSLPVSQRLQRWDRWMEEQYRPLVARRDEYEERTGELLLDIVPMPDSPFNAAAI